MCVRDFLDCWGGKTSSECGQHHYMSWGSGLKKKEKMSWAPAFIFLLPGCRRNMTSCLTLLPTHLHHQHALHLPPVAKINLPSWSFFCQVFCHNNQKSNRKWYNYRCECLFQDFEFCPVNGCSSARPHCINYGCLVVRCEIGKCELQCCSFKVTLTILGPMNLNRHFSLCKNIRGTLEGIALNL